MCIPKSLHFKRIVYMIRISSALFILTRPIWHNDKTQFRRNSYHIINIVYIPSRFIKYFILFPEISWAFFVTNVHLLIYILQKYIKETLLISAVWQVSTSTMLEISELYKVAGSKKVQEMEKELSIDLEELKKDIEDNIVDQIPVKMIR